MATLGEFDGGSNEKEYTYRDTVAGLSTRSRGGLEGLALH